MIRTMGGAALMAALATGPAAAEDVPEARLARVTLIERSRAPAEPLPPEVEDVIGRAVGARLLARFEYREAGRATTAEGELDGLATYVTRIGARLGEAASGSRRPHDRPAPAGGWHVTVLASDEANGYAAPGGRLFVTTSAIALARSEDELAALVAHEMAHAAAGHALAPGPGRARAEAAPARTVVTLVGGIADDAMRTLVDSGHTSESERAADLRAVELLAAAGYDPRALLRLLQAVARAPGGAFATHPSVGERVVALVDATRSFPTVLVPDARVTRFRSATAGLRPR